MKLTFRLRFHTEYGQSLFLTSDHELFGNGMVEKAVPLHYLNEESWTVTLELPGRALPDAGIVYNYFLRNRDGSLVYDWGTDKVINPASFRQKDVLIIDAWNHAGYYENAFYTEPFKQVLLKANHTEVVTDTPANVSHYFKVKAPLLAKGQTICLLGNRPGLKQWNSGDPVLMSRAAGEDFFTVGLDLTRDSFPVVYKYGIYDAANGKFLRYEDGANRTLHDTIAAGKITVVNDGFAALPSHTWKGAGVAIPVFSLRSEAGFGAGEFTDLKLLVDWCRQAGLKLIQVLPVNDTTATRTWADCYPYAAISVFALHPRYLNLSRVAGAEGKSWLAELEDERKRLNALETLDYQAVMTVKITFLKKVYSSQRDRAFQSNGYRLFFDENRRWLVPYAVFCYLRDQYGTSNFEKWPAHRQYRAEQVARLAAEDSASYGDIAFHYFVQYHLHLQLREAIEYAHANGIVIKGDIPIGVNRHGADAWEQPGAYRMEMQAGAPPDAFAVKGQNWGFPTYNWQAMKQNGFVWWKQRFEQMSRYFDAFRIDHILGFFRIWSVPIHAVEGIMGCFVPAIPVRTSDLQSRGIWFDRDRYVKPYITAQVLQEVLGNDSVLVRDQFLNEYPSGHYTLKSEFATQRRIEQHFASLEDTEHHRRVKQGLFDLVSNVILFEGEGSGADEFHFRFAVDNTSSFRNLEPNTQAQLKELYVDYFFRRQDGFWRHEALEKLPALKRATRMLVCGEDLGLVPACVPDVMKELGLLSLEVQRMPKDSSHEFFRPATAPYLSVVTPSTHDMSTIRGWWEEDRARTQRFYNQELGLPGSALDGCEAWINRAIVAQHLESPAMWSIFQLQDLLGMSETLRRGNPEAERINVPADPKHYWRYRMHLNLETLKQAHTFNEELRTRIVRSER